MSAKMMGQFIACLQIIASLSKKNFIVGGSDGDKKVKGVFFIDCIVSGV